MDENIKRCKNCKYFIQYYIKSAIRFKSINCGHCTFTNRFSKKSATMDYCDGWTAREIDTEKNEQRFLSVLNKIYKQLDDMLSILGCEKVE